MPHMHTVPNAYGVCGQKAELFDSPHSLKHARPHISPHTHTKEILYLSAKVRPARTATHTHLCEGEMLRLRLQQILRLALLLSGSHGLSLPPSLLGRQSMTACFAVPAPHALRAVSVPRMDMFKGIDLAELEAEMTRRRLLQSFDERPKRIILIRHGESEGNTDRTAYAHA